MTTSTMSADGRFDVLAEACPTRQLVHTIGDRWSLLVLSSIEHQTLRHQQIRRAVEGISQKMLTQTLRTLEREGLVTRTVHASASPKVEYALTPLGNDLASVIRSLREWAYANIDEIQSARAAYDLSSRGSEA
jgi:DNA-binding HxlR family transcriptional regulator